MSNTWGIDKSWGISNPFQFSKHHYASTVSSDGLSHLSSALTHTSRRTQSTSHFPRYPQSHFTDLRSIPSIAGTHASSLKSPIQKHHYYESVESLPSTATIPHVLPSTNLNPPKIIKRWFQAPLVWIKALSICALITFFILSLTYAHPASTIFEPYLTQIQASHSWGIALFAIMLFVSILFMLPQALFIIDGCIIIMSIWGDLRGVLITICMVWSINFIGSIICYFYGRFLMYKTIKRFLKRFHVIYMVEHSVFDVHGWKFVLLLRLLPMNTYNVMNYVLGASSLDLCGLIIASLGMLPNIVLYCLIALYFPLQIEYVLFYVMIAELLITVTPAIWWILWLYWHISNKYDETSTNMIGNNTMDQQIAHSKRIKESFTIDVQELSDDVSNLCLL